MRTVGSIRVKRVRGLAGLQRALLAALLVFLSACGASGSAGAEDEDAILKSYLADSPTFLEDHKTWHHTHGPGIADFGDQFFAYHHQILQDFDAWRTDHGFQPVVAWDPGTPIPPEVPHAGRASNDPSRVDARCRRPTWLTRRGGTARDPEFMASKLAEFTARNYVGFSIMSQADPAWHGTVHNAIGGDMGDLHTAPRDPIFWRFHKLIDQISEEWTTTEE